MPYLELEYGQRDTVKWLMNTRRQILMRTLETAISQQDQTKSKHGQRSSIENQNGGVRTRLEEQEVEEEDDEEGQFRP